MSASLLLEHMIKHKVNPTAEDLNITCVRSIGITIVEAIPSFEAVEKRSPKVFWRLGCNGANQS